MVKKSSWLSQIISRTWLILVVAGVIIGLDQWTKELVRQSIPKYTYVVPFPALGEYFVFEHVENYGAAFGILQGAGNIFIVVAAVVTIGILYYAIRHLPQDQWYVRVLFGMQIGGALGNVIDRINQGYVTDFVKVGIPGVYYWPNFNIADASIVCSVIALAVLILIHDVRAARREKAESLTSGAPGA